MQSIFQIQTNRTLTTVQEKAFAKEVENRLASFGFRGAEGKIDLLY
ncbi:MAG: hypothetical protein AAGG68_15455 [Bacteroidota bacterium]